MNPKSRISSIAKANNLDSSVTGIHAFSLAELDLQSEIDFPLPNNLRLGHLIEKIVSELIKSSSNYAVLYENIQLSIGNITIGEIDFILKNNSTLQLIHLELAYKFYLYDPSISDQAVNNWIGPNRNDTLVAKLDKLKTKQFPLIHHESAISKFNKISLTEVSQSLCLLASLYVPYGYRGNFSSTLTKAIKGYYINLEKFIELDHPEQSYYLPIKREWGIDPSENEIWTDYHGIKQDLNTAIIEKQALLCWQKYKGMYTEFFIVWW